MKFALLLTIVVALVACGSAGTASSQPFCKGAQLSGRFAVVPGSAGAGNIVYRLRIWNHSTATCFVSGLPVVRLLGRTGNPLPTHVSPARPGMGTAARIILAHGKFAHADARFSPDVPGAGETTKKRCELTARFLRVTAPGGETTFDVDVKPPTPVCEHGALSFSLYTAG